MSEESTLCALPSVRVTRRSTIGWPNRQPRSICARTPFSTLGMNWRGTDAADHLVDELEAGALGQRLHLDVAHGVLPVPAGLLDVPAERLRRPGEGLPQRDHERDLVDVHGVALGQPLQGHLGVRLAHRPEHQLVGLGVVLDPQRRVLGAQPGQRLRQLVLVGLAVRDDRDRQQRLRHRPRPQHPRVVHRRERVAGLGAGEPADRAQVAGDHPVRRGSGPCRTGRRARRSARPRRGRGGRSASPKNAVKCPETCTRLVGHAGCRRRPGPG